MLEQIPSHTENFIECGNCHRIARIKRSDGHYLVNFQNCCEHTRFKMSNENHTTILETKKSAKVDEFSRTEEYGFRLLILFLFATTCIMLSHRNDIKDPRFCLWFSIAIYVFTIAVIFRSRVVLLTFVSASGVLFAFMTFVNPGIHNFTIFWQTLLIIDAIVLFFCVLMILTDKKQKRDIDTEEKKSGATKVFKKYDSMADNVQARKIKQSV